MAKIVISCAVTGSIHTPSMSPHLPVTPEDIATQAQGAVAAGAAVIHLHGRRAADGRPSADPADLASAVAAVRQAGGLVNISTGGSAVMPLESRLAPAQALQPDMVSLNMGTMNFALYPMAERPRDWHHAWEKPFLESSDDLVFKNTPRDIRATLAATPRAMHEFECYDPSHIAMLAHFVERGWVRERPFIQFVFGVLGGMPADPGLLPMMVAQARAAFGDAFAFSAFAPGRHQMPFAALSAIHGGHVRVGLEDSLTIARGKLAESNAEQVEKLRLLLDTLGFEPATATQARAMILGQPDTKEMPDARRG